MIGREEDIVKGIRRQNAPAQQLEVEKESAADKEVA